MKSGFRGWIYKGWSGCNVKGTVFRFWREWVKWVSTMQKQGTDIGRFDFVLCLHLCLAWLYLLFDIASSSTENHEGRLCPYFGAIRCSTINNFFLLFLIFVVSRHSALSLGRGGMNFVDAKWFIFDDYTVNGSIRNFFHWVYLAIIDEFMLPRVSSLELDFFFFLQIIHCCQDLWEIMLVRVIEKSKDVINRGTTNFIFYF